MSNVSNATRHFLNASEAMMIAVDSAEGLSSRHLEMFWANFYQLANGMIQDARSREMRDEMRSRYPMRRHDWGCGERSITVDSDKGGTQS